MRHCRLPLQRQDRIKGKVGGSQMDTNRRTFLEAALGVGALAGLGAARHPASPHRLVPSIATPQGGVAGRPDARTIYASSIPGVVLDCDIATGKSIDGGVPTDNAARLNAVLAAASATNHIHLIMDGGSAMGSALCIPQTGYVTVSGLGWGTGFYLFSGSNCMAIQTSNVGTTHRQNMDAIHPPAPHAFTGRNVVLSNFMVHGNKGRFPGGLVSAKAAPADTSLPGTVNADAKGTNNFWYVGIILVGVENVIIRDLYVFDPSSYAINLYKCRNILVDGCRLEAGDMGGSDCVAGIQLEGGCSNCRISNCFLRVNDDAVAFNLFEDPPEGGSDFIVSDCVVEGYTHGRDFGMKVKGSDAQTHRVQFHNISGTLAWWGLLIGNGNVYEDIGEDTNHSILMDGIDIQLTGNGPIAPAMVIVAGNAGLLELNRVKFVDPQRPAPLVLMSSLAATISSLRITNCGIHRSSGGSQGAYALEASKAGSAIRDIVISDFHVTEQAGQQYGDIPVLVHLGGTAVGSLTFSGRVSGVGSVVAIDGGSTLGELTIPDLTHGSNAAGAKAFTIVSSGASATPIPVSVGRYGGRNLAGIAASGVVLTGPGILSCGFSLPDALMGNHSLYRAADHQQSPCIKIDGAVRSLLLH